MSPVGLPETPHRLLNLNEKLDGYFEKKGYDSFIWLWNKVHPSPFDASRAAGIFSYPIIKHTLNS